MRRIAWIVTAALAASAPRAASADDLPRGRLGIVVGLRNGLGELADDYGLGYVYGVDAGWQLTSTDRRWGLAVHWSILWADFDWLGEWGLDPASVTGQLDVLELDGGLRLRVAPRADIGRYLTVSASGSLLRSNVPLPPASKRSYFGPALGLGVEQYFASGSVLVSAEVRYGIIEIVDPVPGSVSFFIGTAFGI